jgi:hypothetical protein
MSEVVNKTRVLVDTCVLLVDPDVLVRIRQRDGLPFLTSTVLDELDFNKDINKRRNKPTSQAEELRVQANAKNAQLIFRQFNSAATTRLTSLPTGEALLGQDVLTQFAFKEGPVFLIGRDDFRSVSNNDAKIIELAKDYRMVLITRDFGMKVRAEALGVDVAFWTGPNGTSQHPPAPSRRAASPGAAVGENPAQLGPRPFALCAAPISEPDTPLPVGKIPESGDIARLGGGHEFRLGLRISAGGEGSIYETQLAGHVCKIYHRQRLTTHKLRKIELMVSRKIDRPGICWPADKVMNEDGEFVGYLMPRASGITMQTAMFVKPRLEKTFPNWNRRDLVNVAGTLIDHISYLHGLNIIIGDINPLNLLVTEDSNAVWMVDTDSFQIEDFPCPVGTVNFTPVEIQGKNYSDFLRTKEHELFAIATMIFMILLPGKPPYSQQGGGSPAENIKSRNFPYRFARDPTSEKLEGTGSSAPQGSWQSIWSHLPRRIREAFFDTFREDRRTSVDDWTELLSNYRYALEQGYLTSELFPLGPRVVNPVQVSCTKCSVEFTASKDWIGKVNSDGTPRALLCPECRNRIRVERLAAQSRRTAEQVTGRTSPRWGTAPRGSGAPPGTSGSSVGQANWSNSARPTAGYRPAPPRPPPAHSSSGGLLTSILRFIFK